MTEEEKPLTREDVLKMIEEHGGPQGLDLSGRNLQGIDLSGSPNEPLALHGIILRRANLQESLLSNSDLEGALIYGTNLRAANLSFANLQKANLIEANLQDVLLSCSNLQETDLRGSNMKGVQLFNANLQGANLIGANLEATELYGCDLSGATLDEINWGPKYMLGDEREARQQTADNIKRVRLGYAITMYRKLKRWHAEAGIYDVANEFYFREMTVKRKALKWCPNPLPRAWSKFLAVICGYGERPSRVVTSAAVVVFGLAGIYSASALTFPSSLYHSVVSFTALGYGLGVTNPEGWVKALGAAEAFMGVFMMALFLITFVRKMTR